ncbi:MAG: asparaginase [Longimicrobiales bacterium]
MRTGLVVAALVAGSALSESRFISVSLEAQELPRILVIATGGTIAGQATGGQLTGEQIVEAVPRLGNVARIQVEEFSRVGSSAIGPDHWVRLSRRITDVLDSDRGLAGVIVMHGTDTMEETAYFLHLTVATDRPVVMVGSMRNSSAVSADGPANLLSAARVIRHPAAGGHGVLVVLNDEIHSARDVRKMDNNRVDTFVSREFGMLGVVDADEVVFRRTGMTRHTRTSELHLLPGTSELPRVPVVADFAGNDASLLRAAFEHGASAIVVQAFGGGRASPAVREAYDEITAEGVPVVLASRVPEGRVMGSARGNESGLAYAGDLSPHKARVLVMLALQTPKTASELQRLLNTH